MFELDINLIGSLVLILATQSEFGFISSSGGQQSTALNIMAKHDYNGFLSEFYNFENRHSIFSNTGNEFDYTYDYLIYSMKEIFPWGNNTFHWVGESVNSNGFDVNARIGLHVKNWVTLEHHFKTYDNIMSVAFYKSCTWQLKINPIYKWVDHLLCLYYGYNGKFQSNGFLNSRKQSLKDFVEDYGKIVVMIGLHAGEEKRRVDPKTLRDKWMRDCIEFSYPLIDLNIGREEANEITALHGYEVPKPSNCMMCPFSSDRDVLYLHRYYPNKYNNWVKYEKAKLKKNAHLGTSNVGVFGYYDKPLPVILKMAKEKYKHLSDAEMEDLKTTHGCVASKW